MKSWYHRSRRRSKLLHPVFPSNPDINTGTLTLQTKVAGVKKLVVRYHGMSLLVKNLSVTAQKENLGVPWFSPGAPWSHCLSLSEPLQCCWIFWWKDSNHLWSLQSDPFWQWRMWRLRERKLRWWGGLSFNPTLLCNGGLLGDFSTLGGAGIRNFDKITLIGA